jgi:hypothetical protein
LDHLKGLKDNVKKGCYFEQQLSGEETLYHTINFVNGQEQLIKRAGEEAYVENLKKANARSSCLQKAPNSPT